MKLFNQFSWQKSSLSHGGLLFCSRLLTITQENTFTNDHFFSSPKSSSSPPSFKTHIKHQVEALIYFVQKFYRMFLFEGSISGYWKRKITGILEAFAIILRGKSYNNPLSLWYRSRLAPDGKSQHIQGKSVSVQRKFFFIGIECDIIF